MTRRRSLLFLGSALAISACSQAGTPAPTVETTMAAASSATTATTDATVAPGPQKLDAPPRPPMEMQVAASAQVDLQAVGGSGAGGRLEFTIDNGVVRVTGHLTGLQPGATHAFHMHETGDCSAPDASSAGGHLNPELQPHGNRDGAGPHHAGDIPNQVAGEDGKAAVDQRLEGLEIGGGGPKDVIGKAMIVHATSDDYTTQPTGDAGGRIACGIISAGVPVPVPVGNDVVESVRSETSANDGNPVE